MKRFNKVSYILVLANSLAHATGGTVFDNQLVGTSVFTPRSISTDAARDLIGWHRFIHREDIDCVYGAFESTAGYVNSFRSRRLAQYFWGSDVLSITGSQVTPRAFNSILADYFGLSPAFSGTAFLNPIIRYAYIDFQAFVGWGLWYFQAHAPLAWSSARFGIREVIENSGSTVPFPAGYMDVDPVTAPYTSWAQALCGAQTFGQVQPLKFGKVCCNARTKFAVSDIEIILGRDLVHGYGGRAGFNIQTSIPTGNRASPEFLLDAVVGNGKHWEWGIGFDGDVLIWEKDGTQRADFFAVINATHICNLREERPFDFIQNGFGSRYILLKQFENGVYTGTTVPAINITTLPCTVHNAIQFDIALMFGYQNKGFTFDIGYNGWIRSSDQVCILEDPFADTTTQYGFKGIQNVVNPDTTTYSTQSTATLHGNNFSDQLLVVDPNSPVFIGAGSLDPLSASSPMQLTHAIFWYLGYAWIDHKYVKPFLGLGSKVEFEGQRPKEQLPNKNTMSQWQVYLKGGVGW